MDQRSLAELLRLLQSQVAKIGEEEKVLITAKRDITPPAAPANPVATAISSTAITVTWSAVSDATGISAYLLERSLDGVNFVQISSGTALSVTDTNLSPSTLYRYRIKAVDGDGNIGKTYSAICSATTQANVSVNWQTVPNQALTVGQAFSLSLASYAPTGTLTYSIASGSLPAGVTLTAATGLVSGTPTTASAPVVTFNSDDGVGAIPSQVTGLGVTAIVYGSVSLAWTNLAGESGYFVERTLSGSGNWVQLTPAVAADVVTYTDSTVAPSTTYDYRVRAWNAAGNGPYSSTATATTAAQSSSNWLSRSTDPNVVVAYDFSYGGVAGKTAQTDAIGGDWLWGSLQASSSTKSRITCEMQNWNYPTYQGQNPNRIHLDTDVYPPGSICSLRYDIWSRLYSPYPATPGEWGVNWRFCIDEYAKQPGPGEDIWIQWRVRMNDVLAFHPFKQHPDGVDGWAGAYTGMKVDFLCAGPQYPLMPDVYKTARGPDKYLYTGPLAGDPMTVNSMQDLVIAGPSEIEATTEQEAFFNDSSGRMYQYPKIYVSQSYYDNIYTHGRNSNYYTWRNEGHEANHPTTADPFPCAAEYVDNGGGNVVWTDQGTAYPGEPSKQFRSNPTGGAIQTRSFHWEPNQWMTLMLHVTVGNYVTNYVGSWGNGTKSGYLCDIEFYAMYDPAVTPGATMRLIHKRSGGVVSLPSDGSEGRAKFGQFAVTPFMTAKWSGDDHQLAQVWYSQILWSKTRPADPT